MLSRKLQVAENALEICKPPDQKQEQVQEHQQVQMIPQQSLPQNGHGISAFANNISNNVNNSILTTSNHFPAPLWKRFYDLECCLNQELHHFRFESKITHVYNPVEYASQIHCEYLRKYLNDSKVVLFVGMNPGPNGMGQTGVPFGNIKTVRDLMKLNGNVGQPLCVHVKRPIRGLTCTTEEPSGVRFWNLINKIAGDLETFNQKCFVHNFCPLALFDSLGHNITPSELKGDSKNLLRDLCLKYFVLELQLLNPRIIVAVGSYVADCVKQLYRRGIIHASSVKLLQLPHPSPRSLNNTNWPEKASAFFEENDLIKYIKNDC